MYETTYIRAANVPDAEKMLREMSEAKVLAGGQTLIATMKQRLAKPSHVIDIGKLAELKGVAIEGDRLVIGAGTPHADVATSALVQGHIPGLAQLAGLIGDPHVRHMGTIGGSIANNDPAADYPAALVGLGATVHTSKRAISADHFFTGMFETALDPAEIVTRVSFPKPLRSAYEKFRNPASQFALVGVFVAEIADGTVRVAVTGAAPCVFRVTAIEAALKSQFAPEAAESATINADGLNSDIHASAQFRAHLIPVLAARAVAALR